MCEWLRVSRFGDIERARVGEGNAIGGTRGLSGDTLFLLAHGAACVFLYCDWYLLTIYVSSLVLRMGMSGKREHDHEGEGYRVMADASWNSTDTCSRACGVSRAERSKTGVSEASAYPFLTGTNNDNTSIK